jgi:oligosaccharide repeat unit polymerase
MLLAAITFISLQKSFHPLWIVGLVVVMIPVYLILTVARSHDVTYLNSIFSMKYEKMPIFITQPYMYIANNYDNFNCMVEVLPGHSYGIKGLFPLWALTGLKFFFPQLVAWPIYVNKKELTTLTMFYDAYYDFGVIGVLVFACILAIVAYFLVVKLREMRNPLGYLLYAQIAIYLMLSFFTTWFSNTTTWFYLILTGLMALYYSFAARRR